ncbi:MAG: 5-formyltetrahydrofolate cyclo-ligase [Actinomycetota bacterium]
MKNNYSKKDLRQKIQKLRDTLPENIRKEKSKIIAEKFTSTAEYCQSKKILLYYPFRSEIDTTIIIKKAIEDNKEVALPKVENSKLDIFLVSAISRQLERGSYNIMEPIKSFCKKVRLREIDLAVVPGVGFDRKFNRLGYGGGFYDRLLPSLRKDVKKIALCFDMQMVPSIPTSVHDVKVDVIITESNIYIR